MKALFFNKYIVLALLALTLSTQSLHAGSEGNGGGGIFRDGKYLTFGSAKAGLQLETPETVPGLARLIWAVKSIPLMSAARGRLNRAILPIGDRKYYSIVNNELSEAKRLELIEAYRKALGSRLESETVVVYAVSDAQETFLLPEFFALTVNQQAAILFHEALWGIDAKLPYKFVIAAEMQFEAYLNKVVDNDGKRVGGFAFDFDLVDSVGKAMKDASVPIITAASVDLNRNEGILDDLLTPKRRISLAKLFGSQSLFLERSGGIFGSGGRNHLEYDVRFSNFDRTAQHLIDLMSRHPKSVLMPALFASLSRLRFSAVGIDWDRKSYKDVEALLLAPDEFGVSLWGFETTASQTSRRFNLVNEGGKAKDIVDFSDRYRATIYFEY